MMGDMVEPPVQMLGKMRAPAKMGEMMAQPLMGSPAPLPLPPPATQPARGGDDSAGDGGAAAADEVADPAV
jgi:hypothetical protein